MSSIAPLEPAAEPAAAPALPPGLLILHGNRLEWLLDAVLGWLQQHPLAPLETEHLLVQSNGIAEWLKMSLAGRAGVCAATRVELPARFLWQMYRAVLGRAGAPPRSPLDEAPLTWRLMRLLPALAAEPGFEPLAQFLQASTDPVYVGLADGNAPADLARRLQLAQRLADLYDQYQVYRADWLQAWAGGAEQLIGPDGRATPLADDQRWQARLWRALVAELDEAARQGVRSEVHARAVSALHSGAAPAAPLPRRVVVFGLSHLPEQTLAALAALARHAQVILAVPNPCRYHWADIIEGRELLARPRALRHPHRGGLDLAQLPIEAAHAQANPLLAAWGRQARDFIRLLDRFDETQAAAEAMQVPRVDLFDEADGGTLLQQVQQRIRDNAPLPEHQGAAAVLSAGDRSIVFHVAHSAMREVEILHDQLLALLAMPPADPTGRALAPRDIVVMLPDIEPWAPLIHAVFGQHPAGDARRIPYEIADLRSRERLPLLLALEWLLRVTEQRCTATELRDLLDVPAVARRFGLDEEGRAIAARWLAGAGVRWGLDAAHRASLGLGACGAQNSWAFGLQRMLLGYAVGWDGDGAVGDGDAVGDAVGGGAEEGDTGDVGDGGGGSAWAGIEPYDEVGGLDAAVAGSLASLVHALRAWWRRAGTPATPAEWDTRCRALLAQFLDAADEDERVLLAALGDALARWREDCELAGFEAAVPLAVLREAWLGALDEPGLRSRFLSGGVVFCTLMPMRAIPFEVVCLLGMNDGDYPRRAPRSDFDLIAQPGQRRPGDHARRDDDRLLMLEALLAARRVFYLSWSGRSVRDNTPQPPSVLVAQLRDYLGAGWGPACPVQRTTTHPLQPFSRRYFEADAPGEVGGAGLFTYAREWRVAHEAAAPVGSPGVLTHPATPAATLDLPAMLPLRLKRLADWLRNPVASHLRERLGVVFTPLEAALADDEPLALDGLDETLLLKDVIGAAQALPPDAGPAVLRRRLAAQVARLSRRGELPVGALGLRWQTRFLDMSLPMLTQWQALLAEFPVAARHRQVQWSVSQANRPSGWPEAQAPWLDDWLGELRAASTASEAGGETPVWLAIDARRLATRPPKGKTGPVEPLPDKLIGPWLQLTAAAACGVPLTARIVGRDAVLTLTPPNADTARQTLDGLLDAWHQGLLRPLPVALRTALAWLGQAGRAPGDDDPDADEQAERAARRAYDEGSGKLPAEATDPALARCWPDWDHLAAQRLAPPDGVAARAEAFAHWAGRLYAPLLDWAADHARATPLPDARPGDDDQDAEGSGDAA